MSRSKTVGLPAHRSGSK